MTATRSQLLPHAQPLTEAVPIPVQPTAHLDLMRRGGHGTVPVALLDHVVLQARRVLPTQIALNAVRRLGAPDVTRNPR